MEEYNAAGRWAPGGEYRLIATALIGGLSGNVAGGLSDVVRASAANYLQGLAAQQVKELTASLGDDVAGVAARAALHAVVGCVGGSATGACSPSALGAASATVVSALLDRVEKATTAEGREQRINLVTSVLAGAAGGLGADATALLTGARLELENNSTAAAKFVLNETPAMFKLCQRFTSCRQAVAGAVALVAGKGAEEVQDAVLKAITAKYEAKGFTGDILSTLVATEIMGRWLASYVPGYTPPASIIDIPSGAGALPGYPADPPRVDPVLGNPDTSGTVDTTIPGTVGQPGVGSEPLVNPIDSGGDYGDGTLTNPMPAPAGPDLVLSDSGSGSRIPGEVKVEPGATPSSQEVLAGQIWSALGYNVTHQKTASDSGVKGVRTADLNIEGIGIVDVYTPTKSEEIPIIRGIEKKNGQAEGIMVQVDLDDEVMSSIASRIWGKPTAKDIRTLFFQSSDGKLHIFNRPTGVK